jgi:hypothetical protein
MALGNRIVARYRDGRIVKGHTGNFSPTASSFLLAIDQADSPGRSVTVQVAELKAIFFVRDFAGDPGRQDRKEFAAHQPYQGRQIEVTFYDGEKIVGSTPNYDPSLPGFFVFPADTESNTMKVFAVAGAVASVCWVKT